MSCSESMLNLMWTSIELNRLDLLPVSLPINFAMINVEFKHILNCLL